MTNSNITLSSKASALIKTFVSREAGYQKARAALLDELANTGWTSAHLRSPKTSGLCTEEAWAALNKAVAMTLPKATCQLVLADSVKGMTDAQKDKRRKAMMQIGSLIKDLRNAMARREPKESRPVVSPSERYIKQLDNMQAWLQEIDGEPAGKAFNTTELKSAILKLQGLLRG